jgi:hypothetical protein
MEMFSDTVRLEDCIFLSKLSKWLEWEKISIQPAESRF